MIDFGGAIGGWLWVASLFVVSLVYVWRKIVTWIISTRGLMAGFITVVLCGSFCFHRTNVGGRLKLSDGLNLASASLVFLRAYFKRNFRRTTGLHFYRRPKFLSPENSDLPAFDFNPYRWQIINKLLDELKVSENDET